MKDSFKELSLSELTQKREELQKKYFDVRFSAVVGYLDNPLEKRNLRRKIARVNTLIHKLESTAEAAAKQ